MSQQSFRELGASRPVVDALAARSIHNPFRIQELVLPDALAGLDVLARSPTGSGKTLAFAVPIVERTTTDDPRPSALVLVPTRELASQVTADIEPLAKAKGLSVASVYGGKPMGAQAKRAKKAQVLVATPGRLQDLADRRMVDLSGVRILVLDEADRMLDMGFRPPVDRILGLTPNARQTLFFSATLDGEVGRLASAYTRDAARHEYKPAGKRAAVVEHRFVEVAREDKLDTLLEHLGDGDRGRTLVFVRTKRGVDRLVKRLKARGVVAVAMHGDKTQGQRERALRSFHSGATDTLVATDVAARGIDVDDVTHVINFDAPPDRDSYVHRVGRTARAGRNGVGITYVLVEQVRDVREIAHGLRLHREFEGR